MSPSTALARPRRPRLTATSLALATAATLLVVATLPARAQDFDNVEVLEAASFVEAGIAVSQTAFPDGAEGAVLVTTANFPDALAASALAASVGAPILFTAPDALEPATLAELQRAVPDGGRVHLMGGEAALSAEVEQAVADAGYVPQRVEGPTRLETAVAAGAIVGVPSDGTVVVARAFGPDGANTPSDRTTGWVDAISCGAYAAAARAPLYLTETTRLSGSTRDALEAAQPSRAIVCGGTAAVAEAVAQELSGLGIAVQRISGPTRVETAIEAAQQLFGFEEAAGRNYLVVPGYGESFGYGLAATPLAAERIAPILLVGTAEPTACDDPSQPSRETLCYLATGQGDAAQVTIVGGEAQISAEVVEAVARAAGGEVVVPPAPVPLEPPTGVELADEVNDGGTQLEVAWDAVPDVAGYNVYVGDVLQGDAEPTVPEGGERYVLSDLARERDVTVTVTSVGEDGSESEPSEAVTGAPTDEVPPPVVEFAALAGDDDARLSWVASLPVDVTGYDLDRREVAAEATTCPTAGYTDLTTVQGRATTTYTDSSAENGEHYCYSLAAVDAAGQRSPRNEQGVVRPAVGQPTVAIQRPAAGEVVSFGAPYQIEYTITDTNDPLSAQKVTIEYSPDAGAAGTYVDLERDVTPTANPDDATDDTTYGAVYTWVVPDPGSTDVTDARIRITVEDPLMRRSTINTANFTITRRPRTVSGLTAIAQGSDVVLTWDRNPETTVTGYVVERAGRPVVAQTDSDQVCQSVSDGEFSEVRSVPQPADTQARVTTTDSPNAGEVGDVRYCYRVRAVARVGTTDYASVADASASANPGTAAAGEGEISLADPGDNAVLTRGSEHIIRYTVTLPAGVTADRVALDFCRDYTPAGGPLRPAACADDAADDNDGWQVITDDAFAGEGERAFAWRVPADARTAQGDDEQGAVRARLYSPGEDDLADEDINTGILFR